MALRFQTWFPLSEGDFGDVSSSTCNATLRAFRDAYAESTSHAAIGLGADFYKGPVYRLCQSHASCILENSSEWTKANLSASNLVLGLLPTILAVVAPSMTEMAVLGVHRPLLSAVLSISTPAILQARVFNYEDPGDVLLTEHQRGDIRHPLIFGPWSMRSAILAGIAELVLTIGILLNTLSLVVQLTNNSVLSWGCTRTWPLFVWMFVPIIIHTLASTGYHLTLHPEEHTISHVDKNPSKPGSPESTRMPNNSTSGKTGDGASVTALTAQSSESSTLSKSSSMRRRLLREITSCTSHLSHPLRKTRSHDGQSRRLRIGILFNSIASFLGFMHLVFGTATFSALLFIVSRDAIGQIAMRLMVSALVCRFIVMLEMAGLRGRYASGKAGEKEERTATFGQTA